MNWNDLSALAAVSRARTMTGAARLLHVDQTTVSRRLKALEESLGVTLVVRQRDGVDLTEAGVAAARSAEVVETVIHDLERNLIGTDAELSGRLRVTTIHLVANYHPDLFTTFNERYPSVQLEVETDQRRRSLARREADIAIRWTSNPDDGLFGRKVARAEFALYAAKKLQRAIGRRARLSAYPWLAFTAETKAAWFDDYRVTHAPTAQVACRYDDPLTMQAAIRDGAGIGFMPCAFGDRDPKLVRLRPIEPGFGFDIWCLTHADLRSTGRVSAFMAHAGKYFDERKDLYAGKQPRSSA